MATQPILTSATAFDAPAWLHKLAQIGGGYALASGGKLWLVTEHCHAADLTPLMAQIVGNPDRAAAVRVAAERRQNGNR